MDTKMSWKTKKPDKEATDIKDLGIKIGSEDEAFWTGIKEKTETELITLRKMLKFNEAILEMALIKITESK